MYEIRIPSLPYTNIKLPETDLFVVVNKFESYTLKEFMQACQKIIQTGQGFLPIIIDSYGGEIYTLLGMVDFLKNCGVKVVTICEAKAMSAGALLFSCGEERYIGETATIMIHEISAFCWGKDSEIQSNAKETQRLNRLIFEMLNKNTDQPKGFWESKIGANKHADLFLTSNQAKRYNLATHIGIPYIETRIEVHRTLKLSDRCK